MKNITLAHTLIDFVSLLQIKSATQAGKIACIEKYEHILRAFFYHATIFNLILLCESIAKQIEYLACKQIY